MVMTFNCAGCNIEVHKAAYCIAQQAQGHTVRYTRPGGGWPAVLFSGPSKELQAFCFVNFDLSAEEFASMSK